MRKILCGALAVVLACGLTLQVFAGCGTCDKTVVENAAGNDIFSTLVAAVKAGGLADTLGGDGPFTVFAPTNEAFEKLPAGTVEDLLKPENKEKLVSILTYHVVPGKKMAADVVGMSSAETVQGSEITIKVEGEKVKVDNANVVKTDIVSSRQTVLVVGRPFPGGSSPAVVTCTDDV